MYNVYVNEACFVCVACMHIIHVLWVEVWVGESVKCV